MSRELTRGNVHERSNLDSLIHINLYGRAGNRIGLLTTVMEQANVQKFAGVSVDSDVPFFGSRRLFMLDDNSETENYLKVNFEDLMYSVIGTTDARAKTLQITNATKKAFDKYLLKYIVEYDLTRYEDRQCADIVIHIRSGDLFSCENGAHGYYIQPPMSYYTKILDELQAKEYNKSVVFVFEDAGNPIISKMVSQCGENGINARFQSDTLQQDAKAIASAKEAVVFGVGTFWLVPQLLFDGFAPRVYFPSNYYNICTMLPFGLCNRIMDVNKYVRRIEYWRNTKEQRELMLTM